MTAYINSKDGTIIAYSKTGKGEPLVLIDGAFCHRKFGANVNLPNYLSDHFTVYTYDRRGRGESGNTLPYSVEREFEDLQAVINEAGKNAFVYGISSGAALALEAANAGVSISRMAIFEAPYMVDNSRPLLPDNYLEQISKHINDKEPGKAIQYFLRTGIGMPAFIVWMMQLMPAWKQMKQIAYTLVYDILLLKDNARGKPFAKESWQRIKIPVLVMSGSKSAAWSQNSMRQLSDSLPNAKHVDLVGQSHLVNNQKLAPHLIKFFS